MSLPPYQSVVTPEVVAADVEAVLAAVG